MVHTKGRKKLFIALAVVVAAIAIVTLAVYASSQKSPPTPEVSMSDGANEAEAVDQEAASDTEIVSESTTDEPSIDPELVASTAINPMMISVSYLKAVGGFEFEVLRNPNGTQYVQFSSPELVGTKCTDDTGVFASIIESPTENETATLTKTISVDGDTYGLSLADATCTNNESLLAQYHEAFSVPFGLLKKL